MPLIPVLEYRIPMFNFNLADEYWPELSTVALEAAGADQVADPALVIDVLKTCFTHLESKFMALIAQETRASFYLAVHRFHESTTALWLRELQGTTLPVNKSDFSAVRRVLKLILEQACANDLQSAANFTQQTSEKFNEYEALIERLLYLGYWANGIAGFISRAQLFPGAVALQFDERGMDVGLREPYATVFDYVDKDYYAHKDDVVLHHTIQDLKAVLKRELGIDYDEVTGFLNSVPEELALVKPEALMDVLVEQGYDRARLTSFFAGLTVNRENKMSFEDCIIRNQEANRYTYRPLLGLRVDGAERWLVGRNKWMESLTTLTTNALPFGVCPLEWKIYPGISSFVDRVSRAHDKTLEHPLEKVLKQRSWLYDTSIESLQTGKETITLLIKDVGEIDLLFIDPLKMVLYVVECKHVRSKFDATGWRRDYSIFTRKYERQLTNKVGFMQQHLDAVAAHLALKWKQPVDLTGYAVEGIFVINAPTIYMYNGPYRIYTISMFKKLVDGQPLNPELPFRHPVSGKLYQIGWPYFQQAAAIAAADPL